MGAWDELLERSIDNECQTSDSAGEPLPLVHQTTVTALLDPLAAPFQLHRKTQSSCAPAVAEAPARSRGPIGEIPLVLGDTDYDTLGCDIVQTPLRLPPRLHEAFARTQENGVKLSTGKSHGYTMSLNLPSSGGPFGPDVFNAFNMIRGSDDAASSEPLSNTTFVAPERLNKAMLPRITEGSTEDVEATGNNIRKSDAWKDLSSGFGYSLADGSTLAGQVRGLSGQLSAGNTTYANDDSEESDFDENFDHARLLHWKFGRDQSTEPTHEDTSGESDEEHSYKSVSGPYDAYSNPSDEEAAREQRMLCQPPHGSHRLLRSPGNRGRPRADTNNTLPSSSIGGGGMIYGYADESDAFDSVHEDGSGSIISNPSDEWESDLDTSAPPVHVPYQPFKHDRSGLSRDFRFPAPSKPIVISKPSTTSALPKLNPGAKEFTFTGANKHKQLEHTPSASKAANADQNPVQAPRLNVAAPVFNPTNFSFVAPHGLRMEMPVSNRDTTPQADSPTTNTFPDKDAERGRDKRQRQGSIDYNGSAKVENLLGKSNAYKGAENCSANQALCRHAHLIELFAQRVDQALEGWAGRILDEVTIMGQVRPHVRQLSTTDARFDAESAVDVISQRVEELLESHLSRLHSRTASTDASDDTQSTIRAAQSSSPLRHTRRMLMGDDTFPHGDFQKIGRANGTNDDKHGSNEGRSIDLGSVLAILHSLLKQGESASLHSNTILQQTKNLAIQVSLLSDSLSDQKNRLADSETTNLDILDRVWTMSRKEECSDAGLSASRLDQAVVRISDQIASLMQATSDAARNDERATVTELRLKETSLRVVELEAQLEAKTQNNLQKQIETARLESAYRELLTAHKASVETIATLQARNEELVAMQPQSAAQRERTGPGLARVSMRTKIAAYASPKSSSDLCEAFEPEEIDSLPPSQVQKAVEVDSDGWWS